MQLSARKAYLALFLVVFSLVSYAVYLQFWQNIEPCPLCVGQRIVYLVLAIILLVGVFHNPRSVGIRFYSILILLVCSFGIGLSARQVWLQALPKDQVPMCGPGINYMIQNFPLGETIKTMFTGTGECAVIHWQFMGLSIAGWSLTFFAFIFFVALVYLIYAE